MKVQEIRELSKVVRLAGYIARLAAFDEMGAKISARKEDEQWTTEENTEWEKMCDEFDAWHYGLSVQEHETIAPISTFMAYLCHGEDPDEHIKLTYEIVSADKKE